MEKEVVYNVSQNTVMAIFKEKSHYIMVANAMVRDMQLAEDLFQESLIYLLEHKDRLYEENIRGYFYKILKNKCLDYLKTVQRQNEIKDTINNSALLQHSIDILSDKSTNDIIFNADIADKIRRCKKKMPDQTFGIFVSHRFLGLSHKEIAAKYGITLRKVNSEIQKAAIVFKDEFQDYTTLPCLALPLLLYILFTAG